MIILHSAKPRMIGASFLSLEITRNEFVICSHQLGKYRIHLALLLRPVRMKTERSEECDASGSFDEGATVHGSAKISDEVKYPMKESYGYVGRGQIALHDWHECWVRDSQPGLSAPLSPQGMDHRAE